MGVPRASRDCVSFRFQKTHREEFRLLESRNEIEGRGRERKGMGSLHLVAKWNGKEYSLDLPVRCTAYPPFADLRSEMNCAFLTAPLLAPSS